jgi:hypothetical protein
MTERGPNMVGVDWSRGRDWSALRCPRCQAIHRWQKRAPTRCRDCGVRFTFIHGERAPPAICPFCAAKPGELHHDNCGLKAARDVT